MALVGTSRSGGYGDCRWVSDRQR